MRKPSRPRDNSDAQAAFLANKHAIDELLDALKAHGDEHFGLVPEEVNWSHVGSQKYWLERLQQVARFAGLLPEE